MAIGIWTPVLLSAVQVVFPERLNQFVNKVKTTPLAAGTHMRFINMNCHPVYIHSSAPADDVAGLKGTPVVRQSIVVLPRVSPIWIYSPYENETVIVDVGTLT